MIKRLKFIFIGDSLVGKTALLLRIESGQFTSQTIPTLGTEFKLRKENIDQKQINVQLWDTAGQERYRKIVPQFFKGIHGAFLVFDISNQKSLQLINYWISQLNNHVVVQTPKVLIGNKCDLIKVQVSEEIQNKIKKICSDHSLIYFQTSAKTGQNVIQSYNALLNEAYKRVNQNVTNSKPKNISLNVTELQSKNEKKKCC